MRAYVYFATLLMSCLVLGFSAGCSDNSDKIEGESDASVTDVDPNRIGILVLGGGMEEDYKADWRITYSQVYYPFMPYGFFAGGPLEKGTCYTVIHFANEAESALCGVPLETPIDIFCNEYKNLDKYPVHSVLDYAMYGDNSFARDCSTTFFVPFILSADTTVDPLTNEVIEGPIVDDPEGPGMGIADISEKGAFGRLADHYQYFKDYKEPYRKYFLKWVFGNDMPSFYDYEPDSIEATNIKDELQAALPEYTFVFRTGWEAYMRNVDPYGEPKEIVDSTETAIKELVEDEKVARIVVAWAGSHSANVLSFGECWRDEKGEGVSILPGKTYKECVYDLNDGVGPQDGGILEELVKTKPWENYASPYPEITHMAEALDPEMELTFASAFGKFDEFSSAIMELLKHTVEKQAIPAGASLKVIIATHGFADGYLEGGACDFYPIASNNLADRVMASVENYLASSWTGKYEVAHGENDFSQPNGSGNDDPPSPEKPFGEIMGTGEHIDVAMNGKYVNELGEMVDNGDDNFDYVVVLPITWTTDNFDTIVAFRHETFGSHELGSVGVQKLWIRQEHDADGTEYNSDDYDDEFYTARQMDGTGWQSTPKDDTEPVYKGSTTNPTTVILSGTITSVGNGPTRTNATAAMVESIAQAVDNPNLNGQLDRDCENTP